MKGATLTFEERKKMWLSISEITEEAFDAYQLWHSERLPRVPQPGTTAPDFELESLDAEGRRTGARVRLSGLRGTPVALVFGSYT